MFIICVLQGVFQKQNFVSGGSNLCTENGVIRIDVGLSTAGEVAVKCVPHFVSDGGNAIVAFLVVKEYEGVHAINAPRVCAGTFTFIFVNINPTFAKAFLQGCDVFFTERLQRIYNLFASFIKVASKAVACVGKGNVNIVGVQFIKTKYIFFQLHIFVQGCQVVVNSLNQAIVERSWDVVRCKRSGQGIRIFVGSCVEVSTAAATCQSAC